MWASGNYPEMVDTFLLPLGPRLVEACRIGAGVSVLDVAAGTGNASIPAAQRGAHVTASDLTPELLQAGARVAEASSTDLEWVTADAEHLPFEDESFDIVMSSIGVMFAPHHQAAADEIVRVCRPGGTIGLLSWTPEGMIGGQVMDMEGENRSLTIGELQQVHQRKTGALIRCACRMGAIAAGASGARYDGLNEYGWSLGIAFQIVDDLLDVTSTPQELGKATAKDAGIDGFDDLLSGPP